MAIMSLQCSLAKIRILLFLVQALIKEIQEHLVSISHASFCPHYILTRSALLNIFIAAPGKQFVIVNPSTVKAFMGENGAIPLLNTAQPIHSVKTDVLPVQRYPIEAQSSMHAFKLRGVQIQLNNLQVGTVSCGGNMCDALMMHENGIAQDKCACYSISEREAKICLVFDLKILYKREDGGRSYFMISNHTSKQFT